MGQAVRVLQDLLATSGLYTQGIDGIFGPNTATAYWFALQDGIVTPNSPVVVEARREVRMASPQRTALAQFYGPRPDQVKLDPRPRNPEHAALLDPSWAEKHIQKFILPLAGERRLHVRCAGPFIAWLAEIEWCNQEPFVLETFETYVMRYMRGRAPTASDPIGALSDHGRGCGADLNAARNPRGRPGTIPEHVVMLAEAWGFTWGGRWKGMVRDDMHFAWWR